ncbi:hypothetical protein HU830_05170 [Lactobacillus sp. DCY120]|uniref:Uncharacterized protein n=1 Tax=Bombilactobacillus apium TaxID=2675299 RepID=A0A850R7P9_9LACO|nr:hypothetical protein [Bombilactobacillus apium]NVY96555.1 hypothetical protein [Bombilactobacillus apium]
MKKVFKPAFKGALAISLLLMIAPILTKWSNFQQSFQTSCQRLGIVKLLGMYLGVYLTLVVFFTLILAVYLNFRQHQDRRKKRQRK